MSKKIEPDNIQRLWVDSGQDFCLCIGSGLTGAFVGDWNTLLRKLAQNQLLHIWSNEYGDDGTLREVFAKDEHFNPFASTGVLEQGEYLLADNGDSSGFIGTPEEDKWREIFFMERVKIVADDSTRAYITEACDGKIEDKSCSHASACALTKRDALSEMGLNDYYDHLLDCPADVCKKRDRVSTLEAVVALCLTGRITHVINYNFDTILEQLLSEPKIQRRYTNKAVRILSYTYGNFGSENRFGGVDCTYIYGEIPKNYARAGDGDVLEISIYHVHGTAGEGLPSVPLIFSEHSYIEYNDSFLNWSNQVLLDLFTRYHTMCIGFSGTDTNFRALTRSLKAAHKHDLFGIYRPFTITITRAEKDIRKPYSEKGIDGEAADKLVSCVKSMIGRYYKSYFDVNVYWGRDFTALADFLKMRLPKMRLPGA